MPARVGLAILIAAMLMGTASAAEVDETALREYAALKSAPLGHPISASDFYSSPDGEAHRATDHILYNSTSGALLYDPDGTGAAPSLHFATLTNHPVLTAHDLLLV